MLIHLLLDLADLQGHFSGDQDTVLAALLGIPWDAAAAAAAADATSNAPVGCDIAAAARVRLSNSRGDLLRILSESLVSPLCGKDHGTDAGAVPLC